MRNHGSEKRFIIPVFITHQGCPHRCVFCNQEVTTDRRTGLPTAVQIEDRVASFLRTMEGSARRKEVAFYGGSFTALPLQKQRSLLRAVYPFVADRAVDSVRVSTRPDAIDTTRLDLLRRHGVQTVELGAQSMVDEILRICNRGHTSKDVVRSARLARSMGFEVGIQIMLGLPGEDLGRFLRTVRLVIDLAPSFVRIYPLLVLRGSPLERLYRSGLYEPLSLEEAVRWAREALGLLEVARIPVIRLGLQATSSLDDPQTVLAGPYHPAFRSLVESLVFYDMACRLLDGQENRGSGAARFRVAPRDLSNLKGQNKENLTRLKKSYGLQSIEIALDADIPRGVLILESRKEANCITERWGRRIAV